MNDKLLIVKRIFKKEISKGTEGTVYISDIPSDCLPTDEIDIVRDEGHYSENESWDAHTYLAIYRNVLETDDEYNARIERENKNKEFAKQRRYENYLKLKQEFDADQK